jgi:hypothetical protein
MSNQTPIRVTGTFTPVGTTDVNIVSPNPLPTEDINIEKSFGTWGYISGIDGTVVVSGGKRIIGIGAYSFLGGTFTINGGDTITIPSGVAYNIEPRGNLVDPTFVFTGTNTFLIETVS